MSSLLPNPNALVAASKRKWTVKLCSNKILQFFSWGWQTLVKLYNDYKTVVVQQHYRMKRKNLLRSTDQQKIFCHK